MSMRAALLSTALFSIAACGGSKTEEPPAEPETTEAANDSEVLERPMPVVKPLSPAERIANIYDKVESMSDAELNNAFYAWQCDTTEIYDEDIPAEFEAYYTGLAVEERMFSGALPYAKISEYAPIATQNGARNPLIPIAAGMMADKIEKFFPVQICEADISIAFEELQIMRTELSIIDQVSDTSFDKIKETLLPASLHGITKNDLKQIHLQQIDAIEAAIPEILADQKITIQEAFDLMFDSEQHITLADKIDLEPGVYAVTEQLLSDIGYSASDADIAELAAQFSLMLQMLETVQNEPETMQELSTVLQQSFE